MNIVNRTSDVDGFRLTLSRDLTDEEFELWNNLFGTRAVYIGQNNKFWLGGDADIESALIAFLEALPE